MTPEATDLHTRALELYARGQKLEATALLERVVALAPDFAEAHNNLGVMRKERGDLEGALAQYEAAVRAKPAYPDALGNRARTLHELGAIDRAIDAWNEALAVDPTSIEARFRRSLALLLRGDFARGLLDFELRWQSAEVRRLRVRQSAIAGAAWDGTPLEGRTLLLHAEQGLGDTIQFVRFASIVRALGGGGKTIVEVQRPLAALLARCEGIDALVPEGRPLPRYDVHAPLLSLPFLLGTTEATIPQRVPYIYPDAALEAAWKERIAALGGGVRIGVAWQGNPRVSGDRFRSLPLSTFAPIARVPGVRLVRLQRMPRGAAEIEAPFPLTSFEGVDDVRGAFMDTAAIMKGLDLVITSDTSIAHLAGALGVKVWVALGDVPDWRWMLERGDSPWYPTMRLFRRRRGSDWEEVFARMASELEAETRP